MSSADTGLLPFLVGIFRFRKNHVCAVVVSVMSGILANSIWRFALQSPGNLGQALFGFLAPVAACFIAYCFILWPPLSWSVCPGESAYPSEGEKA
jgi:hypothetical protein